MIALSLFFNIIIIIYFEIFYFDYSDVALSAVFPEAAIVTEVELDPTLLLLGLLSPSAGGVVIA
jgi:hypothetical protein